MSKSTHNSNLVNGRTVTCKVNLASFQRSNQKSFVNSILHILIELIYYYYYYFVLHFAHFERVHTSTITAQHAPTPSCWISLKHYPQQKPIERKPNLNYGRPMLWHKQQFCFKMLHKVLECIRRAAYVRQFIDLTRLQFRWCAALLNQMIAHNWIDPIYN